MSLVPRAIALSLASAHTEATLPCPDCAASVKARNLERHVAKVHGDDPASAARWTGADHAIRLPLLVAGVGCVLGVFATFAIAPQHYRIALFVFIPLLSVVLGLGGLSVFGRLPATLTLEEDTLVLRYAFGLGRRRVRLPPKSIEVGRLLERRESPIAPTTMENPPSHDVRVGSYLRLCGEGGGLTLGSRTGTRFRKHWASEGWSDGGARRRWDIVVSPTALVALEYVLAEHGALTLRGLEPSAQRPP